MRISDWSSDVCSSDLFVVKHRIHERSRAMWEQAQLPQRICGEPRIHERSRLMWEQGLPAMAAALSASMQADPPLSQASFAPTGPPPSSGSQLRFSSITNTTFPDPLLFTRPGHPASPSLLPNVLPS